MRSTDGSPVKQTAAPPAPAPASQSTPPLRPPSAADALQVEEIATSEGLLALEPEWRALWARCPNATPFQSPAWQIPWWRHIGEGPLWALALRESGSLAGLVPLYIYTKPDGAVREAYLIGTGTTDYLDPVFAPGFQTHGMAAALAHLDRSRDRWDMLDMQELRPDSPVLIAPCPPSWSSRVDEWEACPVLDLPPTPQALGDVLPAKMAHNLRYYERRARNAGSLRFERATAANIHALFDALLRLHRMRWQTKGESGVLADRNVERAHRDSLPALLRDGLLRLYALTLDGRTVAVYYGFMDPDRPGRRAYYYLSGFDPAFAHLSPGTLIIAHAIREAMCEGACAFDFLRGREAYKYLWGANDRINVRRRFWRAEDEAALGWAIR